VKYVVLRAFMLTAFQSLAALPRVGVYKNASSQAGIVQDNCWTGRTTNMGFLTNPGNRGIITLLLRLTQIKKVPARPSKFQLGQGRLLFTVN
jgi:hypothetical protein